MNILTPQQYERLCCLVYIDDLTLYRKKVPIGIIAANLKNGFSQNKPGMSADTDFDTVLSDIINDPELARLTITDFIDIPLSLVYSGLPNSMPGFRAITFYDPKSANAAVVFRGTYGDAEWADNGRRMYKADTVSALDSANYVRETAKRSGVSVESIGVAGHSGGGNKAMYSFITDNTASECFSLDGEGFSPAFAEKYADKIKTRASKIVAYAERRDPVNGLGLMLKAPLYFSGKRGDTSLPRYPLGQPLPNFHIPDALRDEENKIIEQAEISYLSEVINRLTEYVLTSEKYSEKVPFICDTLVTLMMTNSQATAEEQAEAIALMVEAALYLRENDPVFKKLFAELFKTEERMIHATILAAVLNFSVLDHIKSKLKEKLSELDEELEEKCMCRETGHFSLCQYLEWKAQT
jgi:predicted esterase